MSESDKDLDVNPEAGILIALEKVKKRGKGQYFENIVAECSSEFGWDGPKVYTAIEKAKELQMIKCVICHNKISYRKADSSGKNVCIRDNVDQNTTHIIVDIEENNVTPLAPIDRLQEDFEDFKRHVSTEIASLKHPKPINVEDPRRTPEAGINYEKAFIRSLESRILSLEKQLEQKQNIIEKLLIANHLKSQEKREVNETKEAKIQDQSPKRDDSTKGNDLKTNEKIEKQKQHTKSVPTPSTNTPDKKEDNNKKSNENRKQHQTKKKSIFLLGDSIVNGIKDRGLSKQHNVKVRAQPGATTQDMEDHIKPLLRKEPDMVILHCGTNDLTNEVDTISHLDAMVKYTRKESPSTEIVVSNIVTRRDKDGIHQKVTDLNSRVKDFCRNNQLKVIDNSNLDITCLSQKKLHLNRKGTGYLAHNLLSFISEH